MPNINMFELLQQLANGNAGAGAAGGLVGGISKKETAGRIILSMFVGSIAAYYLTPVLVWTAIEHISTAQPEKLALTISPFLGFAIGLVSMGLSDIIERLLGKWLNK